MGWFASGTGAAGLVGAGLWWGLRGLGVRTGLLVCSVSVVESQQVEEEISDRSDTPLQFLPLCMSLTFYLLLPSYTAMSSSPFSTYASIPELEDSLSDSEDDEDEGADLVGGATREEGFARRAIAEAGMSKAAHLTTGEKLKLARPLVVRYMLPLFFGECSEGLRMRRENAVSRGAKLTYALCPPTCSLPRRVHHQQASSLCLCTSTY